jgi:ferric-dicitrate binding protein FerR (iron transport regulator)
LNPIKVKLIFNRHTTSLLMKYLLGETTPEEREKVNRWIAADPSHKSYADDLQKIWKESRRLAPPEPVDASAAWQRFLQSGKIPLTPGNGTKLVRIEKPEKIYLWRAVAAAVILLAAGFCSWWALTRKETGKEEIAALSIKTGSTVRTDTLPDGSRVTLNKFSSLTLPDKWSRGSRVARLTGEAFFQVVHEPSRPFTVEIGSITIQDAGTSFNVRSANGTTEVIVEAGAVVVTDSALTVKAAAGEKVVITAGHGGISKTTADDKLYQYYRTKKFVCHKTPLLEFVAALNEAYGVRVVLQGDAVRNFLLTTTFDNDDLNSILSVVARTFGLVTERKGDLIILKQS